MGQRVGQSRTRRSNARGRRRRVEGRPAWDSVPHEQAPKASIHHVWLCAGGHNGYGAVFHPEAITAVPFSATLLGTPGGLGNLVDKRRIRAPENFRRSDRKLCGCLRSLDFLARTPRGPHLATDLSVPSRRHIGFWFHLGIHHGIRGWTDDDRTKENASLLHLFPAADSSVRAAFKKPVRRLDAQRCFFSPGFRALTCCFHGARIHSQHRMSDLHRMSGLSPGPGPWIFFAGYTT